MSFWLDNPATNRKIKRFPSTSPPLGRLFGSKGKRRGINQNVPLISTGLDSARKSNFEVDFGFIENTPRPGEGTHTLSLADKNILKMAVKHVSDIGAQPQERMQAQGGGKIRYITDYNVPQITTFTFDNIDVVKGYTVSKMLGMWMAETAVGEGGQDPKNILNYKIPITIKSYGYSGQLVQVYTLTECYPVAVRTAEFNSSENDFHTLEADVRWREITYSK